jgi:hypothetical protein
VTPHPEYYDYTEDYVLEKDVADLFNETTPDSAMPAGFAEHIRSILGNEKVPRIEALVPAATGPTPTTNEDVQTPTITEPPLTPVVQRITREMIMAALAPKSDLDEPVVPPTDLMDLVMNNTVVSLSSDPDEASPAHSDFEHCCAAEPAKDTSVSAPPSEFNCRQPSKASPATEGDNSTVSVEELHLTSLVSPPVDPLKLEMPPALAMVEAERKIDKVKRHWSLHRAAYGATRIPLVSVPAIPPRNSSATSSTTSVSGFDKTTLNDFCGENMAADSRSSMTRSGARALPDVKEEPTLESSVDMLTVFTCSSAGNSLGTVTQEEPSHRQMDDRKPPENQHPRDEQNTRDLQSGVPSTRAASMVFKPMSNGLLDAHGIPLPNFSTVNTLSKLNDAQGLRRASLGSAYAELAITPRADKRKSTSTVMREKYQSLFLSLDDMSMDAKDLGQFDTDGLIQQTSDGNDEADEPEELDKAPTLRHLPSSELIDEVQRISVPSVTGLAQRLQGLLPSLRHHLVDKGETLSEAEPIEKTFVELHDLGRKDDNEKLDDPVPDVAETQHVDHLRRSHSKVSERPLSLPPLEIAEFPGSFDFPTPRRIRSASESKADWPKSDEINRVGVPTHQSPRLSRSPNGTSRPWNVESSYPWSNIIPLIDIRLPPAIPPRATIAALPQSSLQQGVSGSTLPFPSNSESPPDATGPLTPKPTLSRKSFLVTPANARRPISSKRRSRLVGSLSRRVLSGQSCTTTASIGATDAPGIPSGPNVLHGGNFERAVDPGDRYPTSGLAPPGALALDDVHSFFSDDDESNCSTTANAAGGGIRGRRGPGIMPRARVGSLRMRLASSIRARLLGPHGSLRKSIKSPTRHASGSKECPGKVATTEVVALHPVRVVGAGSASPTSAALPASGVEMETVISEAMPPTEVKPMRLMDRLKVFFWRGSQLLRSMSGRGTARNSGADTSGSGDHLAHAAVRRTASSGAAGVLRRARLVRRGRGAGGTAVRSD